VHPHTGQHRERSRSSKPSEPRRRGSRFFGFMMPRLGDICGVTRAPLSVFQPSVIDRPWYRLRCRPAYGSSGADEAEATRRARDSSLVGGMIGVRSRCESLKGIIGRNEGTRTARPGEASSAMTNSAEHWKSCAEQQPQGGLGQFGHRAALPCCLALEFQHWLCLPPLQECSAKIYFTASGRMRIRAGSMTEKCPAQ
jgi:hypothetical protein